MSFGGTVQAMIQSLKANARPKRKAFKDWDKSEEQIFQENKELKFKTVSKEELKRIKTKNRIEIGKDQKRSFVRIILIVIVLVPTIVFVFFQFFFKTGQSNYQHYQPPLQEDSNTSQQIDYLLNSGYEWLNKNHYKNARYQFNRVLEIHPENKTANYGFTASFVYECNISNSNCQKATEMLNNYVAKFGSDTSTEFLKEMLKD